MARRPSRRAAQSLTRESWPAMFLHVFVEKQQGCGEDAEPLMLQFRGSTLLGVFDGMGGAGSMPYEHDGQSRSAAYWAARLTRAAVGDWLVEGSGDPAVLHDRIVESLRSFDESHGSPRLGVKGSVYRVLPTTVALATLVEDESGSGYWINAIWSGDSRVWLLTPSRGLQQLTVDDLTSGGDPYDNLVSDSALSNCVCLDRPFVLHLHRVRVDEPFVVLAGTDGVFQYLPSPLHVENMVLEVLMRASTARQASDALTREISGYTGDDATMAGCAVGLPSMEAVRAVFGQRATHMRKVIARHERCMDVDRWMRAWQEYAPMYLDRLPRVVDEKGDPLPPPLDPVPAGAAAMVPSASRGRPDPPETARPRARVLKAEEQTMLGAPVVLPAPGATSHEGATP